MELLQYYTKFNTAFLALQMEINTIADSEKATSLNRALFVMQVELNKFFDEVAKFGRTAASAPAEYGTVSLIRPNDSTESRNEGVASQISIKEIDDQMPKIIDGLIYFTRADIRKLPQPFRKEFYSQGGAAPIRKRADLRYNCSYEIRYRKCGYNISGSGVTVLEAVSRFIINAAETIKEPVPAAAVTPIVKPPEAPQIQPPANDIPTTFTEFMIYYFEKFRVRKVAKKTYENDRYRCKNHIYPHFKSIPVIEINSDMVQDFIDERTDNVSVKTAKEVNSILSGMFDYAIEKKLIDRNPCKLVVVESYESEHGVALTFDEENSLIESLKDSPKYLIPIAVAMYAGLRPCEYRTVTIEGDFIKAQNCKQKTKKPVYKWIPIIPRLQAILGETKEIYFPNRKYLREKLKAACPGHKLYDLRTTFDSRCEYYKVADFARKTWMGHGLEKLRKTYGNLPQEWFLEEAKKLDY